MIPLQVTIPAVFAYADYFWPVVCFCAAFGIGWICGAAVRG